MKWKHKIAFIARRPCCRIEAVSDRIEGLFLLQQLSEAFVYFPFRPLTPPSKLEAPPTSTPFEGQPLTHETFNRRPKFFLLACFDSRNFTGIAKLNFLFSFFFFFRIRRNDCAVPRLRR